MKHSRIAPANELIETKLNGLLTALENELQSDVLAYIGPIQFGGDDAIRDAIEAIDKRRKKITVILETSGGYVQVAHRMADTLRKNYDFVQFLIPNYAMSAGTVLALSGNAVLMDYYSILGPIDPQVPSPNGGYIPVHGYLVQYERLIQKSRSKKITNAELLFLIQKFDPGELYQYEQEMNLSVSLLKEWLVKYKFANWRITKTRKKTVTPRMKRIRAESIARELQNTAKWHSHGRGISMEVLQNELNLEIEDYGSKANAKVSKAVKEYYRLLIDFTRKLGISSVVHCGENFMPLGNHAQNDEEK